MAIPTTTSFEQTLANDSTFECVDLTAAARGSYVNDDEELVESPFTFSLADHEFRSSTFRNKTYTMYSVRGNSVGPVGECTIAFVNKTEDARERGTLSFVVNLPDSDTVKAIDDVAAQIESAAKGKSRPPGGVIIGKKPTDGKKKTSRPTKVKLIQPQIESHEVAGVVKEKKHWPTFYSGTKTAQSTRSDKEFYSMESKFAIPASSMSETFRISSPWYRGTRCPDDFNFLDLVTSQSPEMTRFKCYITPAFLMRVDDESAVHWVLKWKMSAFIPIQPMPVTSTTPTLGLAMISNNEWDAPSPPVVNGKRAAESEDSSDDSDDDIPLNPPKLKRQKAIDMSNDA